MFSEYVDEALAEMTKQEKVYSFKKDLIDLMKVYDVTIQGEVSFNFGKNWMLNINTGKKQLEDE